MSKLNKKMLHLVMYIFSITTIFYMQSSLSMETPQSPRRKVLIEIAKSFLPEVTEEQLESFDNKYLANIVLSNFIEKKDIKEIAGKKIDRIGAIRLALALGADPNQALKLAIGFKDPQIVEIAIDEGKAEVNKMINSDTPLINAIKSFIGLDQKSKDAEAVQEIVKLLIEKGADVRKMDQKGNMPIQWANETGYPPIIGLLYKAGIKEDERRDVPIK